MSGFRCLIRLAGLARPLALVLAAILFVGGAPAASAVVFVSAEPALGAAVASAADVGIVGARLKPEGRVEQKNAPASTAAKDPPAGDRADDALHRPPCLEFSWRSNPPGSALGARRALRPHSTGPPARTA